MRPPDAAAASFMTAFKSGRVARKAGTNPKAMPLRNDMRNEKLSTRQSGVRLSAVLPKSPPSKRAKTEGKNSRRLHHDSSTPARPPDPASKKLSASNCRVKRQRLAPNARRTPISFWRDFARANNMLAMLEQAISNTIPLAPMIIPITVQNEAPGLMYEAGTTLIVALASVAD